MNVSVDRLREKNESLKEFNPMLGHRGCRLGITFPEIYEMQVRAIFEAVAELKKDKIEVYPEVMIPLVGMLSEYTFLKERMIKVADEVLKQYGVAIPYKLGTMIEIPRAALIADEIAAESEFFSFGTNDLTQMTLGFSRDDVNAIIHNYVDNKIITDDPFNTLDQVGVGQLVKIGVTLGRSTRQNLKVGVCGEHGGDPASVEFFFKTGMNYVSCSPFRVPVARLAAAQAAIKQSSCGCGCGC